jgi:hypothetical protein
VKTRVLDVVEMGAKAVDIAANVVDDVLDIPQLDREADVAPMLQNVQDYIGNADNFNPGVNKEQLRNVAEKAEVAANIAMVAYGASKIVKQGVRILMPTGAEVKGVKSLNELGKGVAATGLSFDQAVAKTAQELNFTKTTANRLSQEARRVPRQILAEAIHVGARVADPQGVPGAVKIVHQMVKNGKEYQLNIVLRESDMTILHFHYK